MLYVDNFTTDEWCKKHGLVPEEMECSTCGKKFMTTVPIIMKGYAGLEIPEHGCPRNRLGAIFTPITKEEIDFWNYIY